MVISAYSLNKLGISPLLVKFLLRTFHCCQDHIQTFKYFQKYHCFFFSDIVALSWLCFLCYNLICLVLVSALDFYTYPLLAYYKLRAVHKHSNNVIIIILLISLLCQQPFVNNTTQRHTRPHVSKENKQDAYETNTKYKQNSTGQLMT
jgi:hypothetical protein